MNTMEVTNGVKAFAFHLSDTGKEDLRLEIGDYGHIGSITDPGQILLVTSVEPMKDTHIIVFTLGPNREIGVLDVEKERAGTKFYESHVPLMPIGRSHTLRTDSDTNHVMVATFAPKGFVSVHVVTVIGQGGEFYFVRQQTHMVQTYRGEQGPVCPELLQHFASWKQLNDLAAEHYRDNHNLPALTKFTPMKWDTSTLTEGQVLVTVASVRRGTYGGINKKGESVRIHQGDIELVPGEIPDKVLSLAQVLNNTDGQMENVTDVNMPATLMIGEIVTYRMLDLPRKDTKFMWEGRGVTRTGDVAKMVPATPEKEMFPTGNQAESKVPVPA